MLSVHVDTSGADYTLTDVESQQLPFATSKALNAVAMDVQVAERAQLRETFTLRREAWADRSIKITHFATKADRWAEIAIAPPGDDSKADILGKFEDQTIKLPTGRHGIAVPIDVRRNKRDLVPENLKPKAFGLHEENGRVVGDRGTFVVNLSGGRSLLLQRADLGARGTIKADRRAHGTASLRTNRGDATVLWLFVPSVPLHPTLRYEPTAEAVIAGMWTVRMDEALEHALATAR